MRLLVAFLLASIGGCALTPEDTAKMSDASLCAMHGALRRSPLHAADSEVSLREIINRRLVTEEEQKLIKDNIVQVGMSDCAMRAAWGNPDTQNTTITSGQKTTQHVFRRGGYRAQYVYTTNGVVKSIQTIGQ